MLPMCHPLTMQTLDLGLSTEYSACSKPTPSESRIPPMTMRAFTLWALDLGWSAICPTPRSVHAPTPWALDLGQGAAYSPPKSMWALTSLGKVRVAFLKAAFSRSRTPPMHLPVDLNLRSERDSQYHERSQVHHPSSAQPVGLGFGPEHTQPPSHGLQSERDPQYHKRSQVHPPLRAQPVGLGFGPEHAQTLSHGVRERMPAASRQHVSLDRDASTADFFPRQNFEVSMDFHHCMAAPGAGFVMSTSQCQGERTAVSPRAITCTQCLGPGLGIQATQRMDHDGDQPQLSCHLGCSKHTLRHPAAGERQSPIFLNPHNVEGGGVLDLPSFPLKAGPTGMIRNCCSGLGHTQSHLEVPPKDIDSSNKGQMHGNPLSFTALDDSLPHGAPGVPPTLQYFVSHPPRVFPRTLPDEIFDVDNADPGLGSMHRSGSAISMPLGSNVAPQEPCLASSQNVQEIKGQCPTTRISDMSSSLCLGLGHKLVNDEGLGLNFEGQVDTDRGCLSLKPVIKRPPEVQGGGEGASPHNPLAQACVDDERGHPKRIRTEGLQAVDNKGIYEGCVVGDLGLGSLNGKNESTFSMQSPCPHSVGEPCTARPTKAESSTPSGPLNPMLPWPRFVPCTWDQPFAEHEVEHTPIPPTQKFQVHLTTLSVEPEGGEQQRHLSEATVKHAWQQGGLKGGMPCPTWLECHDLHSLQGWWIHVLDGITRPLSLDLHGGRTIRQERELLGLMEVDAVKCGVVALSVQGVLQARWDYKFPLAANDGVMIVVAPRHIPMYELVDKAISQVRRLASQPALSR